MIAVGRRIILRIDMSELGEFVTHWTSIGPGCPDVSDFAVSFKLGQTPFTPTRRRFDEVKTVVNHGHILYAAS